MAQDTGYLSNSISLLRGGISIRNGDVYGTYSQEMELTPETAHCYKKRSVVCVVTEDGASNIAVLVRQGPGYCHFILQWHHKTGVTPNLLSLSFIIPTDFSTLGKN